jgi:hypothetical protein
MAYRNFRVISSKRAFPSANGSFKCLKSFFQSFGAEKGDTYVVLSSCHILMQRTMTPSLAI